MLEIVGYLKLITNLLIKKITLKYLEIPKKNNRLPPRYIFGNVFVFAFEYSAFMCIRIRIHGKEKYSYSHSNT